MNYFAHALRFLDRPYFVAGTAVPDWLSVADRQVRVRAKLIEPLLQNDGSPLAEVAAGAWQHLHDDGWFHSTRAFFEVSTSLAVSFREVLGPDDSHRTSFLGHIVTELLIDAELIERNPGAIERYYDALCGIQPLAVQQAVNSMAKIPTEHLAALIPRFIDERFLPDYLNDERLLLRLNQVMRRVKLPPLPAEVESVLRLARPLIRDQLNDLLPDHKYGWQSASTNPTSPWSRMMRGTAQIVCVIAIGLGAGLFSVGHYLEPPMAAMSPSDLVNFWNGNDDVHITASILRGVGVCFLTSGVLGLVIPWINALVFRSNGPATSTNASVPPSPSIV